MGWLQERTGHSSIVPKIYNDNRPAKHTCPRVLLPSSHPFSLGLIYDSDQTGSMSAFNYPEGTSLLLSIGFDRIQEPLRHHRLTRLYHISMRHSDNPIQ